MNMVLKEGNGRVHDIYWCDLGTGGSLSPVPAGYEVVKWRPGPFRIVPPGIGIKNFPYFIFMWLVHFTDMLRRRGHIVFLVKENGRTIHYSGVAPRCFKYRFMNGDDWIVGPCVTVDDHQRRGIGSSVMLMIRRMLQEERARLWYVMRNNNDAARRLVERCGLRPAQGIVEGKKLGITIYDCRRPSK